LRDLLLKRKNGKKKRKETNRVEKKGKKERRLTVKILNYFRFD